MHEVIRIDDYVATRFVVLKDVSSGVLERCFDDSVLVSSQNFEFMVVNQEYDCKIYLFGDAVEDKTEKSVLCKIADRNVVVGRRPMVEVEMENRRYYIPKNTIVEYLDRDSFYFEYTRKDLIQVDDVIHPDML